MPANWTTNKTPPAQEIFPELRATIKIRPQNTLFPFMAVSTLLANVCLHLGSPRAMQTSNVGFLLRLSLYFVFLLSVTGTGFLEYHTASQNLFYIHIIQMLSILHLLPKQTPSAILPYIRLLPASLLFRYIRL